MNMESRRHRKTLRGKLVGVVLAMLSIVGTATLLIVASLQIRDSERNLDNEEKQIQTSLRVKGRLMASNHALALRNSVLDNAFSDVRSLVERAVEDDDDVVYGLFLTAAGNPWVYLSPTQSTSPARPAAHAWHELGLDAGELRNSRESEREIQLFGHSIREFSTPVLDGDEVLGTLRYGISTRRADAAVAAARQESRRTLQETLGLLSLVFVGSTVVGLMLAQRAAGKVTEPLGSLTQAAQAIAQGDRSKRVVVQSGDEVETLATSFNRMVDDLDASYTELQALNSNLERRVDERTAQLAQRHKDMRLVLDNVEQGLITVDSEGSMASERSAVVETWLGGNGEAQKFWDFVARIDARFGAQFRLGFECILEDFLPREVSIAQLPRRIVTPRRQLEVTYSPLTDADQFCGLLIVVNDISEKLARERNEREQAEVVAAFQRIIADKESYLAFFAEAKSQVRLIVGGTLECDQKRLRRIIHSLKGNSSLMGMMVIAGICHDMETSMEDLVKPPSLEQLQELGRRWGELESALAAFVREREEKHMVVARSDYDRLIRDMIDRGQSDVADALKEWELEPIETHFDRIEEQINSLATGLNKGIVRVEKRGGGIRMDAAQWSGFWTDFVHILRNSVDHGFWEVGKAPLGQPDPVFSISAAIVGEEFVLECSDNGKGIDWDAIKESAKSMGLSCETRENLVDALFADAMTTRQSTSEFSGRGVGTSAILARTQRMGGRIEVSSESGKGTRFSFHFPRRQLRRVAIEPTSERIAS
jgi:two-component system chemotaxis sensor kinase CheA